ncbi:MAG TPA: hypothetical protein VL307_03315, partial [Chitinophagaceae bacterium]|nr:hypothetical protein [Chitinophagaceae bacterium]
LSRHLADYTALFARVSIDLGGVPSPLTTDSLLSAYKAGKMDHYLEELYFQYGRYLLICSSRPGTLPPNLQGIWSQYDITPWTGGYWHNINIQMNYWPVFSTNLAELFPSFAAYNLAYRDAAAKIATQYIRKYNPGKLEADNGWTIGTGATAYNISGPGNHSGPGTGALTTKLFWDYYDFTRDKKVLKELAYPALLGMSKFLSKVVIDTAGLLLTSPSYSPEQRSKVDNQYYKTTGAAFDQQMIFENHRDVLKAAAILGTHDSLLTVLKAQLPLLDPVQVGWSGQVKEYREETYYGDGVADPRHRHTSQLVGLYPGTQINSNTPAWLDAAKLSLNRRGDKATGWAMAFRLNLWARTKDGDRAYHLLQSLLQNGTLENLWDKHPPFQIDGNFGGTAGIAEMLLQSHEGFIHLLPALPKAWANGAFHGLVARGAFEVSAQWTAGNATSVHIKSMKGEVCRLRYYNIQRAIVTSKSGKAIKLEKTRDAISFKTIEGETYSITQIPVFNKVANPSNLLVEKNTADLVTVKWERSPNAVRYNLYTHFGNDPGYTLVKANITANVFQYKKTLSSQHFIIRLTAVDATGRESEGVTMVVNPN